MGNYHTCRNLRCAAECRFSTRGNCGKGSFLPRRGKADGHVPKVVYRSIFKSFL